MHKVAKPRLLVVCRSYGAASEVWIPRQINSFNAFDISVLCWEIVNGAAACASFPIHSLRLNFDEPEESVARWFTRMICLRDGNLRAAVGGERQCLIEITRQIAPDVILCHFGHTALRFLPVAEMLRIPLVAHFHGLDLSSALRDKYYRWSLTHSLHRFAGAVVVGKHQLHKLQELGMNPEAISLIPCGAPVEEFVPKTDYATDRCRFIAVSRLVPWKGLDITLRAFAHARQMHERMELHIIGNGPMAPALHGMVSQQDLASCVFFHGQARPENVRSLMRSSDVFVQHSLDHESGWQEGFGVSITEASASGLPVLVTDCGGIPDQITDGENGMMTPQRDWQAMAESMVRLARDPALRETLGRAGRARAVREFDSARLAAKLERLLLASADRQASQKLTAACERTGRDFQVASPT